MIELEHLIDKFLSKDITAQVYYELKQEKFDKIIKALRAYEKPDIIAIYDDIILGIEHFEFDSYNRSRKNGSDYRIKDYRAEERIHKTIEEKLRNNNSIIVHDQIVSTSSMENYYNNFESIFKEHYEKVQSYIAHISEDFDCQNKEIHICFFCEDVTPLGNYFLGESNNRKITPLLPIYSNKLRELLENSPLVEYLIIGSFCMSDYRLFIIENTKKTLEQFKDDHKKVKDSCFFSFEPQTTGFALKIPKGKNA